MILWRRRYLRDIGKYRAEGRTVYYTDETWVNAGDVTKKIWVDKSIKSAKDAFLKGLSKGPPNPTGKGQRLIILDIGSKNGFVDGGLLCFKSKKNPADYHDEMNGDTFKDWFTEILPKLDDKCVIVMDNASYHSVKKERVPTLRWLKADIINWLKSKGIKHEENMIKPELMELVKLEKHKYNAYVIDELAREQGKIVLRLPPYHCELNLIELAWSQIKGYVKKNNKTFKIDDAKALVEEGVKGVTPEIWSYCRFFSR